MEGGKSVPMTREECGVVEIRGRGRVVVVRGRGLVVGRGGGTVVVGLGCTTVNDVESAVGEAGDGSVIACGSVEERGTLVEGG